MRHDCFSAHSNARCPQRPDRWFALGVAKDQFAWIDSASDCRPIFGAGSPEGGNLVAVHRLVIDTPLVYIGYGRANRNIGDRIEEQINPGSQVYIVDSNDSRFARFEAAYIEARLIETGAKLGVPLANRVRPFGRDGLAISEDHEQLVAQAGFCSRSLDLAGSMRRSGRHRIHRRP